MLNLSRNHVASIINHSIIDARNDTAADLTMRTLFYVVHLVSRGGDDSHHINFVAAEDREALQSGLAVIAESLDEMLGEEIPATGVSRPIFIRNLFADDRDTAKSCASGDISDDITTLLRGEPDPSSYLVLGFTVKKKNEESQSLMMTEVRATDADDAIRRVVYEADVQMDCYFQPLFSTIKAPVTFKMLAQYKNSTRHFGTFMEAANEPGTRVH